MAFEYLITFLSMSLFPIITRSCDNFATITVKENIPYPSPPLLDVSSLLQSAHITSNNDKASIYLTDVSGSKPFTLTYGKLTVNSLLDREQICGPEVTEQQRNVQRCCTTKCCMYIGVTTEQGKTSYIKVNIEDENDNEPVFHLPTLKIQLNENVDLGYNIALPKADDKDSAMFGVDRYTIIQDINCGDCFQIKSETRDGGPALITKSKVDREINSVFLLQVLAIDKGVPAKTGTMSVTIDVVDINDNSPKFEETTFLINVEENGISGREIRSIKVTDDDLGLNSQMTFVIEDYTSVAQKHFRLFSTKSGVSLQLHTTLDYELTSSFNFKIVARDHGTPSLSSTATVNVKVGNVNDEPPKILFYQRGVALDPNNIVLYLPENGPKQNAIILVHVTDKDSKLSDINCEVLYPKDTFYLQEIQLTNMVENKKLFELQNSLAFDREAESHHRIGISCSDSITITKLTNSVEIQLRINDVNDNPPVFSSSFYFGKIIETNSLDKVVDIKDGVIKVTDADIDVNSRIKFSLADIGNSTDSHKFSISPDYPLIKNVAPIDYEEKKRYIFLLVAKDSGSPVLSTSATITVNVIDANDNRPEIVKKFYSLSVLEGEPIGTEIGRIEATDADTDPANRDFIYEIVNHDGSRSNSRSNKLFSIENNSGRIKTRTPLDHEKDQHVNFMVKVRNTNDDTLSKDRFDMYISTVSVNVKIIDVNDNYPKLCLKDSHGMETSLINEALKRPLITINNDLQATSNPCALFPYTFTDEDEGINSEVKVSLKNNPHFQLEMGHNLICPKNANLAPGQYTVYVIGEDRNGGNGSKHVEHLINVVVKSSSANKPHVQTKRPRPDQDDKLNDYKAIIIFIVLIATIILFCFLLMIVVVKTKLCIPRNMSVPSRSREKMADKPNNSGTNKNYNIIMPGGSCENKRLYSDYIGNSLNNQNAQNSDYSNNLFYPRVDTAIMDLGDCQYPHQATLTNLSHSCEPIFPADHGDSGLIQRGSIDTTHTRDLKYEQLQRTTGHSLSGNPSNWDKTTNHQYNYLLEPRDSGSLPSNCSKTTPPKQDLIAVAPGYQKSINDVYLQTSFV